MKTRRAVSCAAMLRRVSRYLDGDGDAADCRAIQQHCRECATCREQTGGFCNAVGLCRRAGRRRVPREVSRSAALSARRLLRAEARRK